MTSLAGLLIAASVVLGQTDGEKAFKAWKECVVGGVWTTTSQGVKCEISYKPTLNGKFLRGELKYGDIPVTFFIGVDPVTKKCTWWGFDGKGGVVRWVVTQVSENVWTSNGEGMGPGGEYALQETTTRTGPDAMKEEIKYFMVDGEKQKTGTSIWTRIR